VRGTTPDKRGDVTVSFSSSCQTFMRLDTGETPACGYPRFFPSPEGLSLDCYFGSGRFVRVP
jgi:hypothetical protein